ncbi:copper chaperone CopZ [Microaerobacter geothermalis]|uniref:copper chaperone CopZ n=1 Tax=Microaerobacter geothermalis TaxID=674972 RepID=UPI001F231C8A|nr:copper chaperone CopZ [Microaerobacter geothermalis]MCF6093625.1 copper chaperone CopZ [Microaerobacter geothermalis]
MGCCSSNNETKITLTVEGMTCGHCKSSVEKALRELDGVKSATVDLGAKKVDVSYDSGKVTVDAMKAAIEEAGYEVA